MISCRHFKQWRAATLIAVLVLGSAAANAARLRVDRVLVKKSQREMYLLSGHRIVRRFHIALGAHPVGDKRRRGDERTPEGHYTLDFKNPDSAYYKSIHISYPNAQDIARARRAGVDPGGEIMIHGQKNGYRRFTTQTQQFDWTEGCIAVTDRAMDQIWKLVHVGTPIEIDP